MKVFATLVLALTVLAGCGGGSDAGDKPTATPTPRTYAIDELKAALPGKDDVAGVSRVDFTCPHKVRCPAPDEGAQVGIDLALLPAGDNSADIEKAANESLFGNSVSVIAWRHQGSSEATNEHAKSMAIDKKYDGAYDIKQAGDPKTGATPAEKGEGTLETLKIGAWKGQFLDRRGSMSFEGTTEPRLIATASMIQGDVTVTLHLNVHADGRPVDYAEELGRKVLTDYLERLG